MSNEITSILQPVKPQSRTAGPHRPAAQPTVVDRAANGQGDRVSFTDSARLLQLAEAKPGRISAPQPDATDTGMTYARTENGFSGKGMMTSANGNQYTREVAMTFDRDSQSVSRQVSMTGQFGGEVSRSTEISRTDKGYEAVTRRVGVQGNETVRETQVFIDPDANVGVQQGADRLPVDQHAQRPSPQLANMMEAFYTTSDMEGFSASSDLNADGVINFQDLAALRAMQAETEAAPPQKPEAHMHNMTESFFTTDTSQGFDAASDFNDDGMINFQDLALLRSKMESNS